MKKRILLIDGNSFCYRAFYAIRSLSTSKGQPTNAVYGFVTMLNKLLLDYKPYYIACAFDLRGPTFRHKKFADYKSQRPPMPDELSVQMPVIKETLRAYHIAVFEKQGYEADDIIASLACRLAEPGLEILIVTADKDVLQLINEDIKVINPHKENIILDSAWVRRKYGVEPERIVEIMALSGDASDNIPGIPGIGEATAKELIQKFGSLEGVLDNTEKIGGNSRRKKIEEFAEQARMSRSLVQLDCNIEQIASREKTDLLRELRIVEADKERLFKIFKELEFKSLMLKMLPEKREKTEYKIISRADEAGALVKGLAGRKDIALYFWTNHEDPMQAEISGIGLCLEKNKAVFVSLQEVSLNIFRPVLEDKDIKKISHDLKYLKILLSKYEIDLKGMDFDTMIAAYLLNPEKARYALSDLALEYLDSRLEAAEEKLSAAKAAAIFELKGILEKKLIQMQLFDLFRNLEMPLIEVLAAMEMEGVALNKELLLHLSSDFEKELKKLTSDIYEMSGTDFNINSPKQLSGILFERLKLPRIKRTKQGSSTDNEVLQRLSTMHPIAAALLKFREISKLKSTYVDGLLKLIHPRTGKIHTSFIQAAAATGRLSSRQPNLQNIPVKTVLGRKVRQAFISGKQKDYLLSADYSQIELRILAHLSEDKNLIRAFNQDLDIHAYTASLIFGVELDQVTPEMRNTAKTVNFGIVYGMSSFGLAKDLNIEQHKAQQFIDAYFERYAGVKNYIADQIKLAERQGFVLTLLKRRRYIPYITSPDSNSRQFAQRVAINAPVQGSASDLIKMAMIEIYRSINQQGYSARMLLQVHDELIFSVPEQEIERIGELVRDKMENVIKLKIPVKVSIKTGKNWLDLK